MCDIETTKQLKNIKKINLNLKTYLKLWLDLNFKQNLKVYINKY
jgi:hypothetical protein